MLQQEGKTSSITALRIQELERLGFEWVYISAAWENRLSELVDYQKIHGHWNLLRKYSENSKLAHGVANQSMDQLQVVPRRNKYSNDRLSYPGIGTLRFCMEVLRPRLWEERLSELADYRKIHGHCHVPDKYSENTKLAMQVGCNPKEVIQVPPLV
jgi:hypothetical protein